MQSMPTLHTDRLTLRKWILEDFEPFAALPRFGAWQSFSGMIGHWQLRGYGMFAVVDRPRGEFVGRVGPFYPEGWPDFEIGWTLRSTFWGRGYATEAAKACVDYAFGELGREHLVSLIGPDNVRSIRVAQRLGERLEG